MKNGKNFLFLHLAVILFGMAGVFGKLLDLSAENIVFGRVVFASITLLVYNFTTRKKILPEKKIDLMSFAILGGLLAFHWFSFFESIQCSTVAIGLISFSTFPIFTVFLEPIFMKEKFYLKDILFALIAFLGIYIITPELNLSNSMTIGIIWGVLSGLSFAFLSIFNRKLSRKYQIMQIAFYQNLFAALFLGFWSFRDFSAFSDPKNLFLLFLLGSVFTALAHTLFISGLQKISAKKASIIACFEPVYGTIAALIILREIPDTKVVFGGIIILSVIIYISIFEEK